MPDITMCRDKKCPRKDKCYRHTAEPTSYWQTYFIGTPRKGKKCEYFWESAPNEREGGEMTRIFIAFEALNKLKRLVSENTGTSIYEGTPIYASKHYPMFRRNGDIVWGVCILNTGFMIYLVEEIYQVTTA